MHASIIEVIFRLQRAIRRCLEPASRRLAVDKRRLERCCFDCGVSRSVARNIASQFFAKDRGDAS